MFYVNNEQVKGIFLNGRNYNYLAYGFGKIIPEDRNVYQLSLNLAEKYLNRYRIEFGTIKDGYENALVSPRFDKPDSNGIFHTPFTYYYNRNIVLTKNVPVLITNGNYALSNALVYNDMNINGAINHFAENTDFQGHNVNTYLEGFGSSQSYFDSTVMSNCSNFHLRSLSRFGKGYQPTLYNCNNFSGWFNFARGDDGTRYPGFMGFLEDCKDGVFNIDCTNMHGGGSSANVTNYYNFSGIQNCSNIKLNITGSSWQVWPHDHSFSSNCNINTYNVISGFSYVNDCNFNIVLPKDSKPEMKMNKSFEFLNNANNCNYNLYATDVNLYNYRSGVGHAAFFDGLNNCNLNLLVNNTVSFDYALGNNFNHCNIIFDNIKADLSKYIGWYRLYNCNIAGNVEASVYSQEFIGWSDDLNININAAKSSIILFLWRCNNVKGNLVAGDATYIKHGKYVNLNVSRGSLTIANIEHGFFNFNRTNVYCNGLNNTYAIAYNTTFSCHNTNNTEIYSSGSNVNILGANNCYNLKLSGLTFQTPDSYSMFENIYNSDLSFGTVYPYYQLRRVENCKIDGFPISFAYVNNCVFRPFNIKQVGLRNSILGTWNNTWPHRTLAGIRTMDNISKCRIDAYGCVINGSIAFNNVNNMQTSINSYYDEVVTANLPKYNMNIKLNVDCATLNLGIFQAGPPHGFQNATISADNIYAKGDMPDAYVYANCDTKIYCENYCNVCFQPHVDNYNSVLQPVILINYYDHYNSTNQYFRGGLTRIGSLSTRIGPIRLLLEAGACVFINNAVLAGAIVDNSLLFLGSNVTWTNGVNVTNGGRVRNAANLTNDDIRFIDRDQLCWNLWDSGPWGGGSLWDYCVGV